LSQPAPQLALRGWVAAALARSCQQARITPGKCVCRRWSWFLYPMTGHSETSCCHRVLRSCTRANRSAATVVQLRAILAARRAEEAGTKRQHGIPQWDKQGPKPQATTEPTTVQAWTRRPCCRRVSSDFKGYVAWLQVPSCCSCACRDMQPPNMINPAVHHES
jgi:hypothetical protein